MPIHVRLYARGTGRYSLSQRLLSTVVPIPPKGAKLVTLCEAPRNPAELHSTYD